MKDCLCAYTMCCYPGGKKLISVRYITSIECFSGSHKVLYSVICTECQLINQSKLARHYLPFLICRICMTQKPRPYEYRILPGNRSWALFHNSMFFAILDIYPVYWALIMCKIETQLVGAVKSTITIATATRSRSPLASASAPIAE